MNYEDYLKTLAGCPFCEGTNEPIIKSEKSYLTYALSPYHRHHMLVIPNRHVESLYELNQVEMDDIDMLQKKGLEILKKLGYESMSFLVCEGNATNKSINHTHFHIIPNIQIGYLDHVGDPRRVLSKEDIADTLAELKAALS